MWRSSDSDRSGRPAKGETAVEAPIAGITAAVLTLFDLDNTFYTPSKVRHRSALYGWWLGFILVNSALAAVLYIIVKDRIDALKGVETWLGAIFVGLGYLALIRAKLLTLRYQDTEFPVGFELFYEGLKRFFYKRINRIAKTALSDDVTVKANAMSLRDLTLAARQDIESDALLNPTQKDAQMKWLLGVLKDTAASEFDKREILARFLLSGQTASLVPVPGIGGSETVSSSG